MVLVQADRLRRRRSWATSNIPLRGGAQRHSSADTTSGMELLAAAMGRRCRRGGRQRLRHLTETTI